MAAETAAGSLIFLKTKEMVKIQPTQGTQLELLDSCVGDAQEPAQEDSCVEDAQEPAQEDSCVENAQEPDRGDSCANPQLSEPQHQRLLSYLTSKTKTEKNYGSGWLDVSKSAGTAQTENRYLRYNYRVHWRKRRYCKHIGNVKDEKVLKIAQAVRQACDQQKPPHEIVKLIEKMKQEK